MEGRFLLNVIVRKSAAILKLFAGEDEALLVWGDTFLILDLCLHVLNGVRWLNIKSDGLSGKSLNEDLHTTAEAEHQVESGLFLDVVVGEGSTVFELLTSKDEALLIWRNAFFVLDLSLDIFDRVRRLNIEGDGLASKGLDKDLHTTTEAQDEVKGRLLLDVVIGKSAAIFELLASEDKTLLIWGDTFLVLDLGLDVLDRVGGLDIESDGFTSEGLDENLHVVLFY